MFEGIGKRVGDKYHRTGGTVKLVMAFTVLGVAGKVTYDTGLGLMLNWS